MKNKGVAANNSIDLKHENIASQIFYLRGEKVMFDFNLATLYEVETRALKQQVRRNKDRFPDDFMFELTKKNGGRLSQNVITSRHSSFHHPLLLRLRSRVLPCYQVFLEVKKL